MSRRLGRRGRRSHELEDRALRPSGGVDELLEPLLRDVDLSREALVGLVAHERVMDLPILGKRILGDDVKAGRDAFDQQRADEERPQHDVDGRRLVRNGEIRRLAAFAQPVGRPDRERGGPGWEALEPGDPIAVRDGLARLSEIGGGSGPDRVVVLDHPVLGGSPDLEPGNRPPSEGDEADGRPSGRREADFRGRLVGVGLRPDAPRREPSRLERVPPSLTAPGSIQDVIQMNKVLVYDNIEKAPYNDIRRLAVFREDARSEH